MLLSTKSFFANFLVEKLFISVEVRHWKQNCLNYFSQSFVPNSIYVPSRSGSNGYSAHQSIGSNPY